MDCLCIYSVCLLAVVVVLVGGQAQLKADEDEMAGMKARHERIINLQVQTQHYRVAFARQF